MNKKIIALFVICIALVAAAGCMGFPTASLNPSSSSQGISNARIMSESKMVYAGDAASSPLPASNPAQSGSGISAIETKIIKTASMTMEVTDVPGSVGTLKTIASQKGGYLSSTNVQTGYNNRKSGSVILRVPSEEFDATISEIKAIGTVKSASTQGQDVTEEYVDLQAQKISYQNQLAQYNEIMRKAVNVDDVITVQQQIDRVQTELNRLEGRLKYLGDRIDLSTITVNLQEPEPVGGETGHNFISTINEGIAGFFGMIDAIIVFLFTMLPLIIVGCIGYGIYRWNKGRKDTAQPDLSEK